VGCPNMLGPSRNVPLLRKSGMPELRSGPVLKWRCVGCRPCAAQTRSLWTAEGGLYVATVIDLFFRRVVGWSMSATMTAHLVTDGLVMAIWRRGKPDALLHESDCGSQYTSE
jgi:transposase InsO family protein